MILQALTQYYQAKVSRHEITAMGYANMKVSYALRIGWDGSLLGLLSMSNTEERGKKTVEVPQQMDLPEPVVKTVNVAANYLYGDAVYMLGANLRGNKERAVRCFEASRELHHTILDEVAHPAALAILRFFDGWQPEAAEEHPLIVNYLEALARGGNIIFQLPSGENAQDIAELQQAWEKHTQAGPAQAAMQCLVTGLGSQPIARLHSKIKGVKGGQPIGTSIVSFNASAYESYGRRGEQGLNAPIGEYAAFAYTTALNQLLSGPHRKALGNTTVVYWAQTGEDAYPSIFSMTAMPEEGDEERLAGVMEKHAQGLPLEGNLNLDTPFYVLGLSPNAGRLSVRFFWPSTFGESLHNLAEHYHRLDIQRPAFEKRHYLSPYWLLRETVSAKATDPTPSPLLEGALLRSIFTGVPYPAMLAQSILTRIRAERDINWRKAAILKAWLMHNGHQNKQYQEVLGVSLNKESKNKAYVLGRLFAVLEKAQEDANPGINATIKDRYFASACAAPGTVYPILLKLSNYHIAKSAYGRRSTEQIGELMNLLELENDPFPMRLSLSDQAIFVLGYYHERQARYQPKEKPQVSNEESEATALQ